MVCVCVLFVISESVPPYKHPMPYHEWLCYLFKQEFISKLSLCYVSLKAPVLNVKGKYQNEAFGLRIGIFHGVEQLKDFLLVSKEFSDLFIVHLRITIL